MKFLFVMDRLEKLDREWDTSLTLAAELLRRGHKCWSRDIPDLAASGYGAQGRAVKLSVSSSGRFSAAARAAWQLDRFDLILIRKDPPVDADYLAMTYMLESVAGRVPVVNHPRGIRNTNEKIAFPAFVKWMPPTLVSASPAELAEFLGRHKKIVLKPLYDKGGTDVRRLDGPRKKMEQILARVTRGGRVVVAQKYIPAGPEKRVLILNGKILTAYEKRAKAGDFRANLGLGGTFHATKLTAAEQRLCHSLSVYLRQEGLRFAGLDIRAGKLIDFNVTSAAGLTEAKILYPRLAPQRVWADSLEVLAGR